MSNFDIVSYLNSLPDNIKFIDISNRDITYLPDLTRFKNLKSLSCFNNELGPNVCDSLCQTVIFCSAII